MIRHALGLWPGEFIFRTSPTKLSQNAVDTIDNEERRACERHQKIKINAVNAAMKEHGWAVEHVINKLLALKVLQANPDGRSYEVVPAESDTVGKVPESFTMAAVRMRLKGKQHRRALKDGDCEWDDDAPQGMPRSHAPKDRIAAIEFPQSPMVKGTVDNPILEISCPPPASDKENAGIVGDHIPPKYNRIGALSVGMLSDNLLMQMENAIFSKENLKVIAPYGAGYQKNQAELAKCVEYLTGLPGTFPLNGNWASFGVLTPVYVYLNTKRGRRSMTLKFPINWYTMGEYSIDSVDKKRRTAIVRKTHEDIVREIPVDGIAGTINTVKDLVVEQNWSEKHATLSRKNSAHPNDPELFNFFREQVKHIPVPQLAICDKPKMLAIEDGEASSEGKPSDDEPDDEDGVCGAKLTGVARSMKKRKKKFGRKGDKKDVKEAPTSGKKKRRTGMAFDVKALVKKARRSHNDADDDLDRANGAGDGAGSNTSKTMKKLRHQKKKRH